MPAALTEKFDNINLLRAFAALVVVVYHVIEHGHWEAFPAQGPLAVFRIGWIGVDIFFAISGFVIVYSALHLYRRSPPGFQAAYWARRISRIVPLYLLTLSLWVACEPGFFERAGAWWQIVAHLLFVHNWFEGTHGAIDGVNWTLGVEMQFYVLVALLVRWIDRTPGWRILLWCVVVSWAWRACMYALYAGDTSKLFLTTTQLPGALDEFGVGIFLAKRLLDGRLRMPRPRIAWPLLAVATGWIAMTLYWQHAGYWMFPGIVLFWRSAFAVFLLCLLAAAVSLPQVIAYKWLRPIDHLGEVSYGIYLWHLFAIQYAIYAAGYRGIEALAWVVALTVLAASLSWRYFERPLMRLARR